MARKAGTKRKARPSADDIQNPPAGDTLIVPPAAVSTAEQLDDARDRLLAGNEKVAAVKKSQTSANLTFGKIVKDVAKVTGFDPADLKWGLTQKARPPEEIEAEIKSRNRVLAWLDVKIGGQLGMFEDGTSVASNGKTGREEKKEADPQILAACEAQGFQAGKDGASYSSCEFPAGSNRLKRWQKGWKLGNQENSPGDPAAGTKTPTHSEPAHA